MFNHEKMTSPQPNERGQSKFGNTHYHLTWIFIVKEMEEVSLCDLDDLGWGRSDSSKLQYNDYVTPVILVYKARGYGAGTTRQAVATGFCPERTQERCKYWIIMSTQMHFSNTMLRAVISSSTLSLSKWPVVFEIQPNPTENKECTSKLCLNPSVNK